MKNIWFIPLSVFAFSLASCDKTDVFDDLQNSQNEETDNEKGMVKVRFEANAPSWSGNESRTELVDGTKVYWNRNDCVSVFSGVDYDYSEWYEFRAVLEEDRAQSAVLEGSVYPEHNCFFAFYPSSSVRHVLGMSKVYINIPTTQQAVPGSFDNNLNPAWAFTEKPGGSMNFHNIASLIKFSLKGCDDIYRVTLTTKKDMQITGDYYIDLRISNDVGLAMEMADGDDAYRSESVTLQGDFKTGVPYYFVMSPMNKPLENGFTITFEKNDGSKYVKSANAGVINELFSGRIANIGEIDLSDAVFSNDIVDKNFISAVEESTGIAWTKNEDGNVPLTEENLNLIKGVTQLYISNRGLTDLTYLKYFTGLKMLDCSYNNPSKLLLSGLTELVDLNVNNCKLESLDLSSFSKLITLDCSDNNLKSLDLSNNSNLVNLVCYNNWFEEGLAVNHLKDLEHLDCGSTWLTELDLNGLDKLRYLDCQNNHINELNVSNLTGLSTLVCNSNNLSSLDVSGLSNLQKLSCSGNGNLSELNMGGISGLQYLDFSYTNIEKVDLTYLADLSELFCINTNLKTLDIYGCPNLKSLDCSDNPEFDGVLDFSNSLNLQVLICNNSNITTLDLSNCVSLYDLYCCYNSISELNLERNVNLNYFECYEQKLENEAKLQLYLNYAQQSIWEMVSSSHDATVDVHINNEVLGENGHNGFDENDYSGVLK